ncbi:Sec-independent protein translocase protein TatB [Sediminicoccus sp. KRV36]|uniref:Sec-independent protein translocase protein TatB n=1 Tax=Sediminicoccus sp. KRV36 TaxID=3133721 RepID=UPI00200F2C0D|nr:Sec-independent protein translocase protein TatB [Sediminicoccus rosea]UPY38263.1 Sec-independent protein translocase protein TatB [Sediminicoccus rosea]
MLDLAWSEILLIAVVALVVIGPKDLPGAIRGIADLIKTGKRKLASFQQQADELVREAKLDDVRNQIADVKGALNEIRNFDLKGEITKAVDGDGTLTKTFSDNPLGNTGGSSTPAWTPPPTARDTPDAPAMIPPQTMAPYKAPDPLPTPPAPDMPSFVPPSTPAPVNVAPPPVAAVPGVPAEPVISEAQAPAPPASTTPEPANHAPAAPAAAKIV